MDPETQGLLAANQSFYDAFQRGDSAAMSALWAEGEAVACIHPGRAVIRGREAVLESWEAILSAPTRPSVAFIEGQAARLGGVGIVTGLEKVLEASLTVTNIFVEVSGVWRMLLHHASPLSRQAPIAEAILRLNPHWN